MMTQQKLFKKGTRKDCLLQNRYIYEFDKKIDEKFIEFLKTMGEVKVFSEFPIPLITMDIAGKFRLQTLKDTKKLDVFFKKKGADKIFEKKLNDYLKE